MTREELMEKIENFLDDAGTYQTDPWPDLKFDDVWDVEDLLEDILEFKYGSDIDGDCVMRCRVWNRKLHEFMDYPQPKLQDDMSMEDIVRLTEGRTDAVSVAEYRVKEGLFNIRRRLKEMNFDD